MAAEPEPSGALAATSGAIAAAAPLGVFDGVAAGGAAKLPGEHACTDLPKADHKRVGFRLDLRPVRRQLAFIGVPQAGEGANAGAVVSPRQDCSMAIACISLRT